MYEFLDRPVTTLDHGGRFLIWSIRTWVDTMRDKRCPTEALGGAFAKWNMTAGLQPFLHMMTLFNRHAREDFAFCSLMCNHISEHEAMILNLVCSLRDRRPQAVRAMAAMLVEEKCVDALVLALSGLGRSMDRQAIFPGRMSALSRPH